MNPRQRRGVLLVGAAALGGLAVFVAILSYVGSVAAEVGEKVPVLTLSRQVRPYQQVTPDMVETRMLPAKWVSDETLSDPESIVGLVAASRYDAGTTLQQGMLVPRPTVERGYREIAMLVDARTGVAGKVQPGDRVDIIATSLFEGRPPQAELIVQNALVVDVGGTRRGDDPDGPDELVPVTFALPVKQALRVSFAESFSVEVRLALRGGGDGETVESPDDVYQAPGVRNVG